jgi:hypothetical protein
MASPKTLIRNEFPKLAPTQFKVTSPQTPDYNCIGHAAGEDDRFWWPWGKPPYYWPPDLPLDLTVPNFVAAYEKLGYVKCDSYAVEEGFEKVVLYADDQGLPTHAARQLKNGNWTSKLGPDWDIEHKNLAGLSGKLYGNPVQALRRPWPTPTPLP